jgi:hypothetical protein
VHCGAHCVNLVSQGVGEGVNPIRDAMATLQELGNLFSQSMKCMPNLFHAGYSIRCENWSRTANQTDVPHYRWLVRVSAIKAMLNQHEQVSESLGDMSHPSSGPNVSVRGSGLHTQLSEGVTLLSLMMALTVYPILEVLNRSLQSRYQTVSEMLQAVT